MTLLFVLDDDTEIYSITCNDCKYFNKYVKIENGFRNCNYYGTNCTKKNIDVSPFGKICKEYEIGDKVNVR